MKTYREVAERYLKRPSRRLNRPKGDSCIRYVGYAVSRFGDRPIESFKKSDVVGYVEDMQDAGRANGTINSRIRYFLAVLNYAKNDLEIIGFAPSFDALPARTAGRVLTDTELSALMRALPPLRADMMAFGVFTGLRGSNVKGLLWSHVKDGPYRLEIPADMTKAGKMLILPISVTAIELLLRRRSVQKQQGYDGPFVFTRENGKPLALGTKMSDVTFRRAVKRAGLAKTTFHDMRHTWATRHVMAGTPPQQLKELGGWQSLDMVERYTHLNVGALQAVCDNGSLENVLGDIAITDCTG